ncbi:hypothetical protein [Candidatus Amarolinea aalborgensis]|uniref:hypothetical protein n=1 Tax=Candidatus Amarolinea aalborgensis TaxID=2249329 RepID=UPI003BF9B225
MDFLHITTFDLNRIQRSSSDEEQPCGPGRWWTNGWANWRRSSITPWSCRSRHRRVAKAFFLNALAQAAGLSFHAPASADVLFRLGLNRTAISRLLDVLHLKRLFPF